MNNVITMAEFILMSFSTTPVVMMEYSGPDLSFKIDEDTAIEFFNKHGGNSAKPNLQFYKMTIKGKNYNVCSYFSGPAESYYTGKPNKIVTLLLPEDVEPQEYVSPFIRVASILLIDNEKLAQRVLIISKLMERQDIYDATALFKFLNDELYDRLVLTYQEKLTSQGIEEQVECFISNECKEYVQESKDKLEEEMEKEEQVKLLSQLESKLSMIDKTAGLSPSKRAPPRKKDESAEEKKKREAEEKKRIAEEKKKLEEEKNRIKQEFEGKLSGLQEQKETLQKQLSGIEESTREHVMDLTRSLEEKIRQIEQKDQEIAQLQAQNREIAISTRQYVEDLAASLKDKMAESEDKDKIIEGLKAQLSVAERSSSQSSGGGGDPQLQAKLQHLEEQNRTLQLQMDGISDSTKQYVDDLSVSLNEKIQEIQQLKQELEQKNDRIVELEMELEIVNNS